MSLTEEEKIATTEKPASLDPATHPQEHASASRIARRLDVVCEDGPPVFEARRTLFDAPVEADIKDRYVPEEAVVVPVEAPGRSVGGCDAPIGGGDSGLTRWAG